MKAAIIVGHNSRQQGATALDPIGKTEFQFYQDVVAALQPEFAPAVNFDVVTREYAGNYHKEIHDAYAQVDDWGADISVELHFNGATPSATGTETLFSGSAESRRLAGAMQSSMLDALGLKDRGIKQVTPTDRGGLSLFAGRAPAVLIEPFFGTNSADVNAAHRLGSSGFARMIIDGISRYGRSAGLLNETDVTNEAGTASVKLVFGQVSKEEWLKQNRKALSVLVLRVNQALQLKYRDQLISLTLEDVFLIFYAEAGLKGGKIDVSHCHSLGERGLLPLPENISRWVKTPIDPLNPQENVEAFIRYLGAIKNSDVGRNMTGGKPLYRGLFRTNQTALDQARILAGVVHGYFYPPNFDQKLPHQLIADAVAKSQTPETLLNDLGYKHSPESILNRTRNLEMAEKLLK